MQIQISRTRRRSLSLCSNADRPLDGNYGFVYCGAAGLGVGIFNLNGDQIIGCDYGGGRYTGTAIVDSTGGITVGATVRIAPAVLLVQAPLLRIFPTRGG
jgi:hypothetical protein